MDKPELKELVKRRTIAPNSMTCSVTWVDSRIVFYKSKYMETHGKFWFGLCSFSQKVFAVTPLDFDAPTMIASILVSPLDNYCERAYSCLHIDCKLNRFDKDVFKSDFDGCGLFATEFPRAVGNKSMWWNQGEWGKSWSKFIIPVQGGILRFDESKLKE